MGGPGLIDADGAIRHYHRIEFQKLPVVIYVEILIIVGFITIGMPPEKALALRSEEEVNIAFFLVQPLIDPLQKSVGVVGLGVAAKDTYLVFSVFHGISLWKNHSKTFIAIIADMVYYMEGYIYYS